MEACFSSPPSSPASPAIGFCRIVAWYHAWTIRISALAVQRVNERHARISIPRHWCTVVTCSQNHRTGIDLGRHDKMKIIDWVLINYLKEWICAWFGESSGNQMIQIRHPKQLFRELFDLDENIEVKTGNFIFFGKFRISFSKSPNSWTIFDDAADFLWTSSAFVSFPRTFCGADSELMEWALINFSGKYIIEMLWYAFLSSRHFCLDPISWKPLRLLSRTQIVLLS